MNEKLLSFLVIFSLSPLNTVNLISYENITNKKTHLQHNSDNELKINLETNIELKKRYSPHFVLIQHRGYKGAFFNKYKTDTIKNLTNAFLRKTDNNLSIKFKKEFSTYEQMQDYLKIEQQN